MTLPGLYVHIPFCSTRCGYCAFHSWPAAATESQQRVVGHIVAAAETLRANGPAQFATVYVGGGTPSVLDQSLSASLYSTLDPLLVPGAERTIEANPETCSDAFLDLIEDAGFTRLSLGVQSLNPAVLQVLGRSGASFDQLQRIRRRWKGVLSADLIFATPGRSSVDSSVRRVVDLGVDAVSLYELTVEPETPLAARIAAGSLSVPPEQQSEQEYARAAESLRRAGFQRYEVSSFARTGAECRHNQGYWRMRPYIGLGPSAVSTVHTDSGAQRLTWPVAADAGWGEVVAEELAAEELAREMLMLALRTREGLCLQEFAAVFGRELRSLAPQALERQRELETIELDAGRLRATERGLRTLNTVLRDFFGEMTEVELERPPSWVKLRFS